MDVYPQDLGPKARERILGWRAQRWEVPQEREHAHLNAGREWMRPVPYGWPRSRLVRVAIPLLILAVVSVVLGGPDVRLALIVPVMLALGIARLLTHVPAGDGTKIQTPQVDSHLCLYVRDVKRLRDNTDDPLQRAFCDVLQTVLLMPPPSDAGAAREIREAVRALGTAIEGLPHHNASLLPDNPGALRSEADQLAAQAQSEPDSVIAASLERRAQAYTHRAETVERAQTLLRRNEALRREMADQIETLRTSLVAAGIAPGLGAAELTGLAESVQRVAAEVGALSAARAEMDDALHGPAHRPSDQATRVRLRQYLDKVHEANDREHPPLFHI